MAELGGREAHGNPNAAFAGESDWGVDQMLESAIARGTQGYTDMYPSMARTARDEGFGEIADWFETLAKAERSRAGNFTKTRD